MLFGHDKSLVSFHYLDIIFKVRMRHKRKYLSKIMTSVSKPTEQDGEFYLDLHEYVLWAR